MDLIEQNRALQQKHSDLVQENQNLKTKNDELSKALSIAELAKEERDQLREEVKSNDTLKRERQNLETLQRSSQDTIRKLEQKNKELMVMLENLKGENSSREETHPPTEDVLIQEKQLESEPQEQRLQDSQVIALDDAMKMKDAQIAELQDEIKRLKQALAESEYEPARLYASNRLESESGQKLPPGAVEMFGPGIGQQFVTKAKEKAAAREEKQKLPVGAQALPGLGALPVLKKAVSQPANSSNPNISVFPQLKKSAQVGTTPTTPTATTTTTAKSGPPQIPQIPAGGFKPGGPPQIPQLPAGGFKPGGPPQMPQLPTSGFPAASLKKTAVGKK